MILEKKIQDALVYFGPMTVNEIQNKLHLIGIDYGDETLRVIESALYIIQLNKYISYDKNTKLYKKVGIYG